MTTMDDWMNTVCAELDVPRPDMNLVLDLARDVAHGVERAAAPLTAYLYGVAVGRGADPVTAAAALTRLANGWAESES